MSGEAQDGETRSPALMPLKNIGGHYLHILLLKGVKHGKMPAATG
jgi:hypothetical protein